MNVKNIQHGGVMYVVRLMNINKGKSNLSHYLLGKSKPCQRCQSFIHLHNIKTIKYTDIIDGVSVLCEMKRV
jgi:hypothetical protein